MKEFTPLREPRLIRAIRQLTIGEIALAKTLYGYSIRYHLVWVHRKAIFLLIYNL